ncbi:MAG: glycosyltransferase family 4 protein [Dongiaceae bacterium]
MARAAPPPLRLLMTADAVGGVWSYALTLARALAPHGVRILLATFGPRPSPDQRAAAAALGNLRLEDSDFSLEWQPGGEADFAGRSGWLRALARRWRPDIVHLNDYAHGACELGAPVLMVAHSDVLSWFRHVEGRAAPPDWQPYRRRVAAGLAGAHRLVAPTAAVLADLERAYGARPAARMVIPHGLADAPPAAAERDAVVLAAGRLWDPAKNLALLDRVAAGLPWPVAIAGDPAHPAGGVLALRHAEALGRLPQAAVRARMARAAIYALPARYEPFGLSVLEAAAGGCALVLGDIASLRETWAGAALFVPPDDEAALGEALRRLIAAPAERARLAERALRRARALTAAAMAERTLDLYRSLRRPALRATA